MTELIGKGLIEARLNDNYSGDREIFYPASVDDAPKPTQFADGYIKATFATGVTAAFQADTGAPSNPRFRHPGLLILSVFFPRGKGMAEGDAEAEALATIFRGQSDASGTTTVKYRAPNIRPVGPSGSWYQIDVEIPFDRDTVYSVS